MKNKYNYKRFVPSLNPISAKDLKVGDLLFNHSSFYSLMIPGFFTHIGVFGGYDENNKPFVYESFVIKGTRKVPLDQFTRILTVATRVPNLKKEQVKVLTGWLDAHMGLKFSINAINKRLESKAFYCSELTWAAFMQVGINLDYGKILTFTITPQQIYDHGAVKEIGILKGS